MMIYMWIKVSGPIVSAVVPFQIMSNIMDVDLSSRARHNSML